MKGVLITYIERFHETIKVLTHFFALESYIELSEMITVLLKYSAKHKEFVEKLMEKKWSKERSKAIQSKAAQKDYMRENRHELQNEKSKSQKQEGYVTSYTH